MARHSDSGCSHTWKKNGESVWWMSMGRRLTGLRKGKVLKEDAESDEVKEMKRLRQQVDDNAKVG